MIIEYLLVRYPDDVTVIANGANAGLTNHTMLLPADEYLVTIDAAGCVPASQDVVLTGTAPGNPLVIDFFKAVATLPTAGHV